MYRVHFQHILIILNIHISPSTLVILRHDLRASNKMEEYPSPGQIKLVFPYTVDTPGKYKVEGDLNGETSLSLQVEVPANTYTITVLPSAGGTVFGPVGNEGDAMACQGSSTPGSAECVETYQNNTRITLKSKVEPGWVLVGWDVNGVRVDQPQLILAGNRLTSRDSPATQISGDAEVKANYSQITFQFVKPDGSGTLVDHEIIHVNDDDDDGDSGGLGHGETDVQPDWDDQDGVTGGDDDLLELRVDISDPNAKMTSYQLEYDETFLQVWTSPAKNASTGEFVVSNKTSLPLSQMSVWVEGRKPHGTTTGSPITLRAVDADGHTVAQRTVTVVVADIIFAVFGTGGAGEFPLVTYLESVKYAYRPPLYLVRDGENPYYSVDFCYTEACLKFALATDGSSVVYDGHSNFGIGPAFSENLSHLSEFINIGRPDPDPANFATGSYTGIDWTYLRNEPKGHPHLEIMAEEIPGTPVNYTLSIVTNRLKFENNNGIGDGASFPLQGTGYNRYHYTTGSHNEPRLIVKTGNDDVPELRYNALFMNSCSSGDHFIETFQQGVFFYTVQPTSSFNTTKIFVENIVQGKAWEQIKETLNQEPDHRIHEYHDFGN